jgi:predicted ribosome quality control (RQC) complex YloA/Tae2 family protein
VVRVTDEQEIREILAECRRELVGGRVENVHQSDEHSLVVSVYARSRGKRFLFLCARPRLTRFHLLSTRPAALSRPPVFCEVVRKRLKGRFLLGVRAPGNGLGVELRFAEKPTGGSSRSALDLALRLDGALRGLMLLQPCGAGRQVLASLGGIIPVGETFDAAPVDLPAVDVGTVEPAPEAEVSPATESVALVAPASARLEARYVDLSDEVVLEERRRELLRAVKREAKRRDKTLSRVREDLEKAQRGEDQRIRGELLQAALGQVRRGMHSVEVVNYFDPQLARICIELDPALGPQENLKRYFKRYQKAKRALPFVNERLSRLEAERDALREVQGEIEAADALAVVVRLEEAARPLLKKRRQSGAARAKSSRDESPSPLGPRRFLSIDGYEILVGRNARGNDQLSIRLARGNDLFLHVAGRPGAHVVIRTRAGKSVPQPTLLDAAQLALYYALAEKLRRVGGAEARGEVDYTPAKYVQKPKGARPGLVYLAKHKTLHVQLDLGAIDRLMRSTEKEG